MMHARYLCKQIRRRFPKVKLVVGLWDMQGDMDKAKERIGCGAIVVSTLADAQEQIRLLIQELLPKIEQQTPPEPNQTVMRMPHPSNYPSNVDVRSNLQRVPPAEPIDSANLISN
jgi:hypothetical protein